MQISRRQFLQVGAIPFLGLSLPHYLRAEPVSKKSVIFFNLYGGPSQIDTYDPKPEAPSEIRGAFGSIKTAVPGLLLSETLPEQAKIANKLFIIRSFTHNNNDHSPAQLLAVTGHDTLSQNQRYPSVGSISAHLLNQNKPVPLPYLFLGSKAFMNFRNSIGNLGFISSRYAPKFIEGNPNEESIAVKDLELFEGISLERLRERQSVLKSLDNFKLSNEKTIGMFDAYTQNAIGILTGQNISDAFTMDHEADSVRDVYGRSEIGQRALLARRLIEAGVHFVGIEYRPESSNGGGWDYHSEIFKWMPVAATPFDQALAALVNDLDSRGLLDQVLVIAFGEFGRTYKVNKDAGRDHQPEVGSVVMAGAGVVGGAVYGASDSRGARVKSKPVSPADLLATIYSILGFPPDVQIYDKLGLRISISEGQPIHPQSSS